MLIRNMHGLGDTIHSRALLRYWLAHSDNTIQLETSWPCVFWDMADRVQFIRVPIALRTQTYNADREKDKYFQGQLSQFVKPTWHIRYTRDVADRTPSKSVLETMFWSVGIKDGYETSDFTLPIQPDAAEFADGLIKDWHTNRGNNKPICIYRPLTVRPEFRGTMIRNANVEDYAEVFSHIREKYFVVSVAYLEDSREWITGPRLKADVEYHKGELVFEKLAALVARAEVAYCSNGMMAILAPAVGTRTVSICGGYEPGSWLADGAKHAPYLAIEPLRPCNCGFSGCNNPCDKKLDVFGAVARVRNFCGIPDSYTPPTVQHLFDNAEVPTSPRPALHVGPPPQFTGRNRMQAMLIHNQQQRQLNRQVMRTEQGVKA